MEQIQIALKPMNYAGEEAFKSLRTNLLFCGDDKQVILLTSCTPSEGKSTVSLNLAASIAETGRRVLIIDADIRKSVLITRTSARGVSLGLTHYLSGQKTISDVIYQSNITGLDFIFSGPVAPNPAELLGSDRFKNLIEAAREVYDYIIIDSPPVGSVIDSAIMAESADGIIFVFSQGGVSYKFAQTAVEQMKKTGCPILGSVLNKVSFAKSSYYGKYYGKYYGNYYGKY